MNKVDKKILKEIENFNIEDGRIPLYKEFLEFTEKEFNKTQDLTLGDYMDFLTLQQEKYVEALNSRNITKNLDFKTFVQLNYIKRFEE